MPRVDRLAVPDARRAIGIAPADRVLAHFGFLMPDKGVLEVMRAVAALRASAYPDLRYWISGALFPSEESREYYDLLIRERARLRLDDAVHLTGEFVSHDDASRAMAAADWVVLNYRTGGAQASSGAVTRALASGTPVAVSTAPIFDDVRDAVHTIGDPLEQAIARLLDDRVLADRVRSRAAAFCAAAEWSRIARRHADLYRRVLADRRPARARA
jgi:glycosyltransferase involved in cell wall biosynthesis